ncbi:MAG: glutathione S-transferase family protein [Parashewanella sp.]
MITLYGTPKSRALRVSWLLEELELDWKFEYIDFAAGDNRSKAFLALNPSGKIPVITDGDNVLFESAAICLYLAEKYGNGRLLPRAGTASSGKHHQWMSFITTELEQALWSMGKHKFALPEEVRVKELLPTAVWEFNKAAALAENMMPETEFLLGEELTVADIMLAQTLLWATVFEQHIPAKLAAFRDKMQQRISFTQALKKSEAEVARRKLVSN